MESYASAEPHNRPQTPRALSPMVTRCLPLGNPLEGCFCVHAYIHVYIYTCIILQQEERGECSSIESPSVVVLLTPLSLSSFLFLSFQSPHFFSIVISTAPFVFFLLHLNYFSLSFSLSLPFSARRFRSSRLRAIFFSHRLKCQSTPGACSLDAKGELIISLMQALKNILFSDRD